LLQYNVAYECWEDILPRAVDFLDVGVMWFWIAAIGCSGRHSPLSIVENAIYVLVNLLRLFPDFWQADT
jgi:hypothetical protein